jgi:DNA polymerase-3 subunit gamma/tau
MSLYRQYRPQSFNDVSGQEHIVSTLLNAVKQDTLSHAYLFAGPRGTGKTSIARILAKDLLARGVDAERKALILKGVEDGNLVDLTEIDAASNRGIDDIRGLVEKIQFTPVIAAAKVYIIDEVHMLTKEAFNALLKTLEEPPPYAYFILATTELHKIPATIQSRCQRYLFRQLKEDDVVARLRYVADAEKIAVDDEALRAVARSAHGGMRDALSLLDQLRALPSITAEEVRERAGESGHDQADAMLAAVAAGDRETVIAIVRALEDSALPIEAFIRLMLATARESLHRAVHAGAQPTAQLALLDALLDAAKDARSSPLPSLALEARLLALLDGSSAPAAGSAKTPAPLAGRSPEGEDRSAPKKSSPAPAAKKESSGDASGPSASAQETIVASAPSAPSAPSVPSSSDSSLTLDTVRAAWPEILKAIEIPAARMSLKNGQLRDLKGNDVVVAFTSSFHRDKVLSTEAARAIEAAMEKALGRSLSLRGELEAQAHAHPQPDTGAVNLAEAAAEIF